MFPTIDMSKEEPGVFPLLYTLCGAIARDATGTARPAVLRKMRARAYELLLHRGSQPSPRASGDSPVSDLLTCYYVRSQSVKSLAEQSAARDLHECIKAVRKARMCETETFESVLRLLVRLKDEVPPEYSFNFQGPFSLGRLEALLPRLPREDPSLPLPYAYYQPHMFLLSQALRPLDPSLHHRPSVYTEYTVESFHSSHCLKRTQSPGECRQPRLFEVPSSLAAPARTSSAGSAFTNYPLGEIARLMAPRDLQIPTSGAHSQVLSNPSNPEVEEMYRASESVLPHNDNTVNIWQLASSIDKNIPDDIWDIASKLPVVEERRLIAMSAREVSLWKDIYGDRLNKMDIVSEKQFIRHIMYLSIGIETYSFTWSEEHGSFSMRSGLSLEGLSKESVLGYVAGLLSAGTCYRRLYNFAFDVDNLDQFYGNGYIFEAAKNEVRRFLLKFRLQATEIFEECFERTNVGEDVHCLPTLLQIMYHMEPLQYEIETVASIYKVIDADTHAKLPTGAGLMKYLYNEISLITHARTATTLYRSLYTICKVYFKFIERFIFEGELEDRHEEFFIRKDPQHVHSRSKRYWDRGFHIADAAAVPRFLHGLAKYILLCGKSFRLLKLCNPTDPLVLLISSDHPTVECCSGFARIERQRRLLELYRTRCLFVRGAPVTFQQLVLKREADKKAFTEMASVKQAETMEKIVAERKRLAELIVAEKQHNLRILEAAIAETKASKIRMRQRDTARTELEIAVDRARDEADSILRDEERNKMLEYYSKLNLEVEKRTAHTEWKIKRLQLNQERMQLLSSEERNFKREKLELEHFKIGPTSEPSASSSISFHTAESTDGLEHNLDEVSSDVVMREISKSNDNVSINLSTYKSREQIKLDNDHLTEKATLDSQGNIILPTVLLNDDLLRLKELNLSVENCHSEFENTQVSALKNKYKVLSHETYGDRLDSENNITSIPETYKVDKPRPGETGAIKDDLNQFAGCNQAFIEAKRNQQKILGSDNSDISSQKGHSMGDFTESGSKDPIIHSGVHSEANRNKLRVLGTDEDHFRSQSMNKFLDSEVNECSDALSEAKRNKLRILGTDDDNFKLKSKGQSKEILFDPEPKKDIMYSVAHTEAKRNKLKVLSTDDENFKLKSRSHSTEFFDAEANDDRVCSDAHTEARRNKLRVLGTDDDNFKINAKSQSTEQLGNFNVNPANTEARRNRLRAFGTDKENPKTFSRSQSTDYLTVAQKEALINRQKVLGTEYHLDINYSRREPLNAAQQEAVRNKEKVLTSEYGTELSNSAKVDASKRANLTLDLKAPNSRTQEKLILGITPTTGGITPGDFFTQLDLETPTTADVPFGAPSTAELLSPRINSESIFNTSEHVNDFVSSEGFRYPSVILEDDNPESVETSHDKTTENIDDCISGSILGLHLKKHFDCIKSSIWDMDHKPYNFESFDPFGVKGATVDSKSHLSCKMMFDMKRSCYTNPLDIIKETQKKPYGNIFNFHSKIEDEPDDSEFESVNIATLTACFQRSIMLPLSYQLEMVNNSILTYFLIDLDMFEHLRSLKDYFFLMDGEFSRTICQNLFQMLVKTINPDELLNYATLHSILDKALGSSITNVNKFSENLSFTISDPPLSFHHSSPDVLLCLSLTYSVSWPMNIILSVEALSRYARVFQFLLKMRRISWMLGQDFEVLKLSAKLSRESRTLLGSPQYNSVQLYRHTMASLVRALDSYIATTCIHSSWTELEGDLKKAQTLDDLYDCHVLYVKKVLFRCLLNKRSTPVMKLLNDIFTVILRFSHVLSTRSWIKNEDTGHFILPCFMQLEELFYLFEKLTHHLHKTISRLMECGYQPHLAELLTMINLNGHYDPVSRSRDSSLLDTTT